MSDNIIITTELYKDEEVTESVKLLSNYCNVKKDNIFKYEELDNYKRIDSTKIKILFVGHNSYLSESMINGLTREEVLQKIADIQQKQEQLELDIEFFSCHLYKNLSKIKFNFLKKEEKFKNISLRLNLYASQYYLTDNLCFKTLKKGLLAKEIYKEKRDFFVKKTMKIENLKKYEHLIKPIVPVFEPAYDKYGHQLYKRFAFYEGHLNKENNLNYLTLEELEDINKNFIERITLDRKNKEDYNIFEKKIEISY